MSATSRPFEDILDQDQTVQIVLSDLRSTLSDDEIIKFQNNFEIAFAIDLILSFNLIISDVRINSHLTEFLITLIFTSSKTGIILFYIILELPSEKNLKKAVNVD